MQIVCGKCALLLLGLMLICIVGCCGPVAGLYPPPESDSAREIFVVDNHWHTGLVLSQKDLSPSLKKSISAAENDEFIEFGWGDEGFYRASQVTVTLALQAMFCSRGSVMHVQPMDRSPVLRYDGYVVDVYRLRVSPEGLSRLVKFLEESFATKADRSLVDLGPGLYPSSRFYQARGRYSVFHTCNQWTSDALRSTGFPITSFYATTSGNVAMQLLMGTKNVQANVLVYSGTR